MVNEGSTRHKTNQYVTEFHVAISFVLRRKSEKEREPKDNNLRYDSGALIAIGRWPK